MVILLWVVAVLYCTNEASCSNGGINCIICELEEIENALVFFEREVDCRVINGTSNNTFVIVCDFERCNSSSTKSSFAISGCGYYFRHNNTQNGIWIYRPFFAAVDVPQDEQCPDIYSLSSYDEIFTHEFYCMCGTSNCNELENITVSLVDTIVSTQQPYSHSSVISDSSTNSKNLVPNTSFSSPISRTEVVASPPIKPTSGLNSFASKKSSALISTVPFTSSSNGSTNDAAIEKSQQVYVGIIAGLVFALTAILAAFLLSMCVILCRKRSSKKSQHSPTCVHTPSPPPAYDMDLPPDNPLPFTMLKNIGRGKFGSVYKALYEGSPVAVRVFSSHHRSRWDNERKLYTLDSIPHKHILHYICSEERSRQLYTLTEYHTLGSLNHYLQHNTLTWPQTLKMISSVSSGLAHLHSNVFVNSDGSIADKFAIAHRDVKSANVLVKDNSGHCVLGDLGLALILDPEADDRKMAKSGQVGTYRYMAPETLDACVNLRDLESFKQIDVYALALVVWEVCNRCEVGDGNVPPYQPPYFGIVGERPTLEMMRETVVLDKSRPDTVGSWHSHPGLKQMINIMEESWDEDPEARLTAANIVCRLETLERALRKQELIKELNDPFNEASSTANHGSSTHNKFRVSSSFSGHSSGHSFILPTRLSVGNVDELSTSSTNTFQKKSKITKLTDHSKPAESGNLTRKYCINTSFPEPSDTCTCSDSGSANSSFVCNTKDDSSSPIHDDLDLQSEQYQTPESTCIDAATGQPKRSDDNALSSQNSYTIHDSDEEEN